MKAFSRPLALQNLFERTQTCSNETNLITDWPGTNRAPSDTPPEAKLIKYNPTRDFLSFKFVRTRPRGDKSSHPLRMKLYAYSVGTFYFLLIITVARILRDRREYCLQFRSNPRLFAPMKESESLHKSNSNKSRSRDIAEIIYENV